MGPLYINKTRLTYDMYKKGIIGNYKASHLLLRVFSTAYALILLFFSYVFSIDFNWTICIPFFIFAFVILFWNAAGYRIGTKKSFLKFAKLHQSHYYVDMEYRFYEDRIEQETSKTELTVRYDDISIVHNMEDILVIVFNKQVIIVDKKAFEAEGELERLLELFKSRNIKIKNIKSAMPLY